MRSIFTLLLLVPLLSFAQDNKKTPQILGGRKVVLNIPKTDTTSKFMIRCARTVDRSCKPLLVIDGEIAELGSIGRLNPNDIESVTILKGSTATAIYGSDGRNGVILLQLKHSQFIVKDESDGRRIPGATVTFTSGKDTIMVSADDHGRVDPKGVKAGRSYDVRITAIGFKPFETKIKARQASETEWNLQRNIAVNDTVVIVGYGYKHTKCWWGGCAYPIRCGCGAIRVNSFDKQEANNLAISLNRIYPNPVLRGQAFTVEFSENLPLGHEIRIMDISGRTMFVQSICTMKDANRLNVNTDSKWTAGVYLVQLIGEGKRLIKQEKLLLQ